MMALATDERTDELLRPFLDAIDADPSDPNPVSILADRLEEVGDERAVGLRWLIENGRKPEPPRHRGPNRWDEQWNWWPDYFRGRAEATSLLPAEPYESLVLPNADFGPSPAALYLSAAAAVSTWLTGGAMNDECERLAREFIGRFTLGELCDCPYVAQEDCDGCGIKAALPALLRDYGERRERAGRDAEQSRCAAILETTAELVERALTMTDALKATAELRVEAARYRALARRIRGGPESTPDA
jgi:hypothetical protein